MDFRFTDMRTGGWTQRSVSKYLMEAAINPLDFATNLLHEALLALEVYR